MLSVQSIPPSSGSVPGERLLLGLLDDDVARPGHRQDDVAGDQILGVFVAREGPDDAVVDRLLDLGDRRVGVGLAWPGPDPCRA